MERTIKKNWIVSGLLVLAFVFGLFTFWGVKTPVQTAYATGPDYLASSELKIETVIGGTHSTTFADGKYLHLDPIDKNHYTNSVSAGADMEYDETTGVLKIFNTDNTDDNFDRYISIIATNTTAKKLTIKVYSIIDLYVLDFKNGDLTITNGENVHDAFLGWENKILMTGKLTICGEIECRARSRSNVGLYPDSNSWLSAGELEILDSACFDVVSDKNTYTCAVNVGYLTLNTDGYLDIKASQNTNNSFAYVLYVAYQVNFTKCLYLSLSSPLDTVASITNSTYLKNAVDTAPIEGYDAVINRVKTGEHGDYGEDLYRRGYNLSKLFSVSYNSNGGTGTMNNENVRYNGKLTLPTCTFTAPQGKQFAGWAVGSASATPLRQANYNITIEEPTVVYAIWEDIPANALTGTVAINGNLKFGATLTASLTNTNNTGTLSYQWRRNGSEIAEATNNTYTLTQDDIGYTISVVVSSSEQTGSLTATATEIVAKADGPVAPTGITATACTTDENNNGTLVGITVEMEYKLSSSEDWTNGTGATITNLANGTYNVRYKETATHNAGASANVVVNAYNAPLQYGITVVDGSANVLSAEAGTTITITADDAPSGYVFDKWTSAAGVVFTDENNAITTFNMPSKNVTITATYKLAEVEPEPEAKGGLSAGAVVGIILGVTVVGGIGGFALVWFVIKKKKWADLKALFKKK